MTLYLLALGIGGVLLLFSLIGGGDQHDADIDADVDLDVDVDAEIDGDAGGAAGAGTLAFVSSALPFASLRFWTFFLAFGGLAGTLLTTLTALSPTFVAVLAGGAGYVAGVAVSALAKWLVGTQVTSTLGEPAIVGATGSVVLPVCRDLRGRVRVQLEHQSVDFDAETEDVTPLDAGGAVVVYAVRNDGVVLVTSSTDSPSQPAVKGILT